MTKQPKLLKSFQDLFDRLREDGLQLPQAEEAERAVIGSMMWNVAARRKAIEVLGAPTTDVDSPFSVLKYHYLYRAMYNLDKRNEAVDYISVVNECKRDGLLDAIGGPVEITTFSPDSYLEKHVDSHLAIVQEKFIQRQGAMRMRLLSMQFLADRVDPKELIHEAERDLMKLSDRWSKKNVSHAKPKLFEALEYMDRIHGNTSLVTGIPTGLYEVNRITAGWQRQDFVVLGARPSQGKTAISLHFMVTGAKDGAVTLYHSIEMSALKLIMRMICAEANVDSNKARRGQLSDDEWRQVNRAMGVLSDLPIYIDDTSTITVGDIRSRAYRVHKEFGLDMLFIDYLQLVRLGEEAYGMSRQVELGKISRQLNSLKKELDTTIIALAQLGRSVEQRKGGVPTSADLRESGDIEQDADVIGLLYRPEKYGIMIDDDGKSNEGILEIIFDKMRDGATDTARVKFIKDRGRFEDRELKLPYDQPVQEEIAF